MRYGLSKSRMLHGLQCPKRLYLELYQPELAEATNEAVFTAGHAVGDIARKLYPGGILIEHTDDLATALAVTQKALQTSGDFVLFEPAVQHGGILVRADILQRRRGRLKLIEVKAAASIKGYYYNDVAIQA